VPLDVIYEWVTAHRQSILTEVLCYFRIPCSQILRDSLKFVHVFSHQYYFQFIIQLLSCHLMLCIKTFIEVCRLWLLIIFVCFDVVTFEFMPWVQHLCQCWEHNCNWLYGITRRTVSYCSWFSRTFWQWCHCSCDFILRDNKKSQRTKTGKSGLCMTIATFAVASSSAVCVCQWGTEAQTMQRVAACSRHALECTCYIKQDV
jgi:hypothetical protein